MFSRTWFHLAVLLWLLLCYHNLHIHAQSEVAIGAYRTFERTSFSCSGRPSGYYADVETGCQVYHMCDGLGRQFSYSCPNTTLFQQRMLICDHWYMVNCSKAERDYTANLLIGQRDKPFVNDEDANLRTPRPDLLDRPYAPDYSGESFRSEYQKSLQPLPNVIYDNGRNKLRDKIKSYENHYNVGQHHWKIPPPSRKILPPAFEVQLKEINTNNLERKLSTTTRKPFTTATAATTKFHRGADALHQRTDYQHIQYDNEDLGTSHSTRYNTSADFNTPTNIRNHKAKGKIYNQNKPAYNSITATTTTTTHRPTIIHAKAATTTTSRTFNVRAYKSTAESHVKVPSKIYEPPLLHSTQNTEDQRITTVARPLVRPSTSAPFSTRHPLPTTVKPNSKPTTMAGKPFIQASNKTTLSKSYQNQQHHADIHTINKAIKPVAPAHGFQAATTPTPSFKNFAEKNDGLEVPSKALLPPLHDFITHDVATTQGPPIYYEWKVPSEGLEPPKLDPPIGVNGREYHDTIVDYNTLYSDKRSNHTQSSTQKFDTKKFNHTNIEKKTSLFNAFKNAASNNKTLKYDSTQPKPAASIKTPTTQLLPTHIHTHTNNAPTKADISEIRKEWSIPEYAFPLESDGRTGYLSSDIYNSFQLKIPDGHNAADEHLHWFGENPNCPQCHPSYVKPGTCEPCLRR